MLARGVLGHRRRHSAKEEGERGVAAEAEEHLGELLHEVGRVYIPALLANNAAIDAGSEQMETTIDGQRWVQPTFPYQAKCLQALRHSYFSLDPTDRESVDEILSGTGCEAFLSS